MKAIYSDDRDKGPGHGFLRVSEARIGNLEGLRFSIKRGTDHNCLGPGGWQPAESPLTAGRITLSDEGFDIAVGPEVVDHLDTRENYRLSLVGADGASETGALRVPEVAYSPVGGGQGIGVAPAPKVTAPPPPPPPAPEPTIQEIEEAESDMILPPPEPAPAKKRSLAPILLLVLLLALAGGGFAAWKFWPGKDDPAETAGNTNATQAGSANATLPGNANATLAEENKEPAREEAKAPPRPALAQAREHLAGSADPAESVKLAQTLRAHEHGADASFLLLEDAAQKGNAEAMLLTGGYFDPVDKAPAGSIRKDPAEALAWYKKAGAAGNAQADARIAALRSWAQAEAARGSPEARELLTRF